MATTEGRDELRDRTRQFFELRAERRLTDEDVWEIGENLVGFFSVLGSWTLAEHVEPAHSPESQIFAPRCVSTPDGWGSRYPSQSFPELLVQTATRMAETFNTSIRP
jgi:hypothetical protein